MKREVFRDAHAVATVDDETRVMVFRRTAHPFASIAEIDAFYRKLESLADLRERPRLRLLIDVRDAPSRNDDAFEAVLKRHESALFGGWQRRAVLVRTAAGKLQVKRLGKANAISAGEPFDDEAAAMTFLTG